MKTLDPERMSEAELTAQLAVLGNVDPGALAVFEELARAILPAGGGEREHLTWAEPHDGADRGAAVRAGAVVETTEQRLATAEKRFRTLVEQIPAVTFMAVLGEGKNEVYVSPHVERILGYTQEEWLSNPFLWYWRLHPDDRVLWNEEFGRGCRTGGPFRAECRFVARDGHVVWIHGEARIVKDELGRPQFLQGVAFDITESKRAQEVVLNEAVRTARVEEEIAIARRVQTSLLPKNLALRGLEVSAAMIPASEVGGDYYDVVPTSDGGWVAIGDVSGHGLTAGLVMLMVQSAMSTATASRPDATPRHLLELLNRVLYDNIRNRLEHGDFVTLSLLRYFESGRLLFAGAHQDILLRRAANGRVEEIETPGTWLGAAADITAVTRDNEIELAPGDLFVLFTDGITEATSPSGELYGVDRLIAAVEKYATEPVERVRARLFDEVRAFTAGGEQADDMTIVVGRFTPADRGGGS